MLKMNQPGFFVSHFESSAEAPALKWKCLNIIYFGGERI